MCNGLDDDGDGQIDEDMPDMDADGIPDCLDGDCDLDAPPDRAEHDGACLDPATTTRPPADPWNVVVEWSAPSGASVSTPAVGDLDLDGSAEVAWVDDESGGRLLVTDGASGATEWSRVGPEETSGAGMGDVDGDGRGDVVVVRGTFGNAHTVHAFDRGGGELWSARVGPSFYAHPALGDVDGDGVPEVLVNEYLLDGRTGAVEAEMDVEPGSTFGAGALADIDLDGRMEALVSNRVFEADGTLRFACGAADEVVLPIPAQLDADPEAEIVTAAFRTLTACDTDGAVLWERAAAGYVGTTSGVDRDGDGVQEIVMPDTTALRLLRSDGSEVWSVAIDDPSAGSGAAVWDVDLDEAAEVFYRDEHDFIVVNGATGAVEWRLEDVGSWTSWETPAVADVDGDGSGEVLFVTAPQDGSAGGLVVVGGADGDWPPARPVYNQATFADTTAEDDLGLPRAPEPSWLVPGAVFRGQISAVRREGLPNARVEVTGVCAASCEPAGTVEAWIQVWNDGERPLPADTLITLYGTPGGTRVEVASVPLGVVVDAGGSIATAFTLTVAQAGAAVLAEVDGPGVVAECHEDDNEGFATDIGCP